MVTQLVSQMTKEELREMISGLLDEKLYELFGDPDEGLELRDEVRESLIRQRELTAKGDFGIPLDEAVKKLGLD